MVETKDYAHDLRDNGLRSTKSRIAILEILGESKQPISAEEIYLKLKDNKDITNLSTVYRNLDTLEQKNIVTKLGLLDDDKMLYEYNSMAHRHYLVCSGCKKIVTIQDCPLTSYEKTVEEKTGFSIKGHKLYLYGYCKDCNEKG